MINSKKILSNIVIILNKKQVTADALANYVGREKLIYTQILHYNNGLHKVFKKHL
ncbi:hypothetical protein BHO_0006303 (plasmid) [Borrelia hermsii YBT]|nr:hypothetical protein BHO_0006303 [Borrelia hermsii YBT]